MTDNRKPIRQETRDGQVVTVIPGNGSPTIIIEPKSKVNTQNGDNNGK